MAVVFQEDPFNSYGYKDHYNMFGGLVDQYFNLEPLFWDSPPPPPSSMAAQSVKEEETKNSSLEINHPGDELPRRRCLELVSAADESPYRPKRRRVKSVKNMEEIENQRMTHIKVERNRRKLMNEYLAILRSLMPPSYAQRGDQASIIGGSINFVKELEQLLQFLEAHKHTKHMKHMKQKPNFCCHEYSHPFRNFFTFPQYSICSTPNIDPIINSNKNNGSTIADIEVTMVETHVNIKVLSSKQPKQLLKMVMGFHSLSLTILHLNITTSNHMVLYTFSVKVEEDCQLTKVDEIATAVHEILGMIKEEALF